MRIGKTKLIIACVFGFAFQLLTPISAIAAECTPTTTVGNDGYTTLEFVNTNNPSNTTGSNSSVTCTWTAPKGVTSIYVVVVGAGGSGGFGNQAGGGGGGQVMYTKSEIRITSGSVHTITVGSGGIGTTTANSKGNDGASSSFNAVTANGGGAGGGGGPTTGANNFGNSGGSSGGGSRFGITSTQPNLSTSAGWVALGNAGGSGDGRQDNNAGVANSAGAENCYTYGAGGGGGGAMSAGQSAVASCTGSRSSDVVTVTAGNGGSGAVILGRCFGGGGVSSLLTSSASNLGTKNLTEATQSTCLDVNTRNLVAGLSSGGLPGCTGTLNTGGGGAAGVTASGSFAGANGIVLVRYFMGVTSGLVAAFDAQNSASYSGSGTAWNDLSKNGFNAKLVGATKNAGGYMDFNGTNAYVTVDTITSSITWTSGLTVSFYANFASTNNWQRIIDFGNGQQTNNILVARPGSTSDLFIEIWTDINNHSSCNFPNATSTNQWRHYAIGVDSADCFLYVDGVLITTQVRSQTVANVTTVPSGITLVPSATQRVNNFIGKSNWSADAYYQGGIRSLFIYNRALLDYEVRANRSYQTDTSGPTITNVSVSSTPRGSSYVTGDTITVSTTWSETVVVTSTPQIAILGLTSKKFTYADGSGSRTLNFVYTVVDGDFSLSGIGLSANSFDTTLGSVMDYSYNAATYGFTAVAQSSGQKVGQIAATVSLALTGNATFATYRNAITITATVNAPGKISFYFQGKIIPGCRNVSTVTSSTTYATCVWKPSVHNSATIRADITPSNGATASSATLMVPVIKRSGLR